MQIHVHKEKSLTIVLPSLQTRDASSFNRFETILALHSKSLKVVTAAVIANGTTVAAVDNLEGVLTFFSGAISVF